MQSFIIRVDKFYIQVITDDKDRIVKLVFSTTELPVSRLLSANVRLLQDELNLYFSSYPIVKWKTQIALYGSSFEMSVWDEIKKIPYGQTLTYQEIAQKMGNKFLARAVGNACKKNPIPIIIPCHRVIKSSGDLGGYSQGKELKQYLLQLESSILMTHMVK